MNADDVIFVANQVARLDAGIAGVYFDHNAADNMLAGHGMVDFGTGAAHG